MANSTQLNAKIVSLITSTSVYLHNNTVAVDDQPVYNQTISILAYISNIILPNPDTVGTNAQYELYCSAIDQILTNYNISSLNEVSTVKQLLNDISTTNDRFTSNNVKSTKVIYDLNNNVVTFSNTNGNTTSNRIYCGNVLPQNNTTITSPMNGDIYFFCNDEAHTIVGYQYDILSLAWNMVSSITLPQGEKGDPGEAGKKGEKGDPGADGAKGDTGATGPIPNLIGGKGVSLPSGGGVITVVTKQNDGSYLVVVNSEKGEKGDPGVAGKDGAPGIDGEPGRVGAVGEKGEKGDPGESNKITVVYSSLQELLSDDSQLIGTNAAVNSSVEDEDNAKWYCYTTDGWEYITDLSGPAGKNGESIKFISKVPDATMYDELVSYIDSTTGIIYSPNTTTNNYDAIGSLKTYSSGTIIYIDSGSPSDDTNSVILANKVVDGSIIVSKETGNQWSASISSSGEISYTAEITDAYLNNGNNPITASKISTDNGFISTDGLGMTTITNSEKTFTLTFPYSPTLAGDRTKTNLGVYHTVYNFDKNDQRRFISTNSENMFRYWSKNSSAYNEIDFRLDKTCAKVRVYQGTTKAGGFTLSPTDIDSYTYDPSFGRSTVHISSGKISMTSDNLRKAITEYIQTSTSVSLTSTDASTQIKSSILSDDGTTTTMDHMLVIANLQVKNKYSVDSDDDESTIEEKLIPIIDNSGNVTATHLSAENGWVYTNTTEYTTKSAFYEKMPYISFRGWKVIDNEIWQNQSNLYRSAPRDDKFEVFVHPDGSPDLSGAYNMSLAIDAFVGDNNEKRRLAVIGSDRVIGHESVDFIGDSLGTPSGPFYVTSRIARLIPKPISELKIAKTSDISTITSSYMAGSIGLSTDYFMRDSNPDGFITPVIWDSDTDSYDDARPLGAPYIPAKYLSNITSKTIPIGTQSYDLLNLRPTWYNGTKWAAAVIDGQRANDIVSTSLRAYRFEFIDSWNCGIIIPNMYFNQVSRVEGNNGLWIKYFEKTRPKTDTYNGFTGSGRIPTANLIQFYNPIGNNNQNNFYFDSPIMTEGFVRLGKYSNLTIDNTPLLNDGCLAIDNNGNVCAYRKSAEKWNEMALVLSGDITTVSTTELPIGTMVFDTTSNSPNWWTGAKWSSALSSSSDNVVQSIIFRRDTSAEDYDVKIQLKNTDIAGDETLVIVGKELVFQTKEQLNSSDAENDFILKVGSSAVSTPLSLVAENNNFYTGTTEFGFSSSFYDRLSYFSANGWEAFKGQASECSIMVHSDGMENVVKDGYNFNLSITGSKIDGSLIPYGELSTDGIFGHDRIGFDGSYISQPENPFYFKSRLFRMLPSKLTDLQIPGKTSDRYPNMTNSYMSGSVGLATDYFSGSASDKTDGFITPVIWDNPSDDPSSARPLGTPYIPSDKYTQISTTNIPVGTQSYDSESNSPIWWDGSEWKPAVKTPTFISGTLVVSETTTSAIATVTNYLITLRLTSGVLSCVVMYRGDGTAYTMSGSTLGRAGVKLTESDTILSIISRCDIAFISGSNTILYSIVNT